MFEILHWTKPRTSRRESPRKRWERPVLPRYAGASLAPRVSQPSPQTVNSSFAPPLHHPQIQQHDQHPHVRLGHTDCLDQQERHF